jgi:hypothetical protein
MFSMEGIYSLNLNQPNRSDLNFTNLERFTTSLEGRPVFVGASSIVPTTGLVSTVNARKSTLFGPVISNRSDARSISRQLTVNLSPDLDFASTWYLSLAYTLSLVRALPFAFFCMACGTVAVRVPVMKPAEINMAPYSSVAIGGMTGNGDRMMSDSLEEALVNTQRFTVVDRQHMDKVLRELQLSSTDLADPNAAAKLGKVVTAGALIFGDVNDNYREQPGDTHYKDDKGVQHTWYTLRGEVTVRATFKITDVSTGRLIIAKTYEERRDDTNRGLDRRPDPIDRQPLERAARAAVLERCMKAIVAHPPFI